MWKNFSSSHHTNIKHPSMVPVMWTFPTEHGSKGVFSMFRIEMYWGEWMKRTFPYHLQFPTVNTFIHGPSLNHIVPKFGPSRGSSTWKWPEVLLYFPMRNSNPNIPNIGNCGKQDLMKYNSPNLQTLILFRGFGIPLPFLWYEINAPEGTQKEHPSVVTGGNGKAPIYIFH